MSYFVFEGVDGVGKTSVMKEVIEILEALNEDLILTKEPGGPVALAAEVELGYKHLSYGYNGFRNLCVDNPHIPALTKRALFKADSLYNWEAIVKPNLEEKLILSDRSWVSDIAYGSILTELEMHSLYQFNMSLVPEQAHQTHVIYLYASEEIREKRLSKNMSNEMDNLGSHIRQKIALAYEVALETYLDNNKVIKINTNKPIKEIAKEVINFIYSRIENI